MSNAISYAILAFISLSILTLIVLLVPNTKSNHACKMIGYEGFEAYRCSLILSR